METIRAIIRGDLAPAGNKILLDRKICSEEFCLPGFSAIWVDSGTSALALALCSLKKINSGIINPKVIIPGYCCPDLVAAAVFAGLRPVAVDVSVDSPFYDLSLVEGAIDADTVAIIGVNFLGYQENLNELRLLANRYGIALIEDNAQWFPDQEYISASDYVIFSFGRGKPLSLLGGGVLFFKGGLLVDSIVDDVDCHESGWRLRCKYYAYNFLLMPQCYAVLNRLPFLGLGRTRYCVLHAISLMDSFRKSIFYKNYESFKQRDRRKEASYDLLLNQKEIRGLGVACSRLLRFPVLCSSVESREGLYDALYRSGLGVSRLYNNSIDLVDGVEGLIDIPLPLKNANSFAGRLLTLPLHDFVTEKHISLMQRLIELK